LGAVSERGRASLATILALVEHLLSEVVSDYLVRERERLIRPPTFSKG